jgi:hypothetical protein
MTNFFWSISQLDVVPQEGNLDNVVTVIYYSRTATEGEYVAYYYGAMKCKPPSEIDFTNYVNLTFKQVCGWLESTLDTNSIDLGLQHNIYNQINPPIVVKNLPWGA